MRIEFLLTHSKSWRKKPYVSASQAASTKKATMETQIVLPRKNIPITNLKKVAKAEDMLPRLLLIMLEPTILMLPMLTLMLAWLLLWWVQPMRPRPPAPMVVVMAVVMAVMVVVDMLLTVGLAFPFLLQYYCQICICRFFSEDVMACWFCFTSPSLCKFFPLMLLDFLYFWFERVSVDNVNVVDSVSWWNRWGTMILFYVWQIV